MGGAAAISMAATMGSIDGIEGYACICVRERWKNKRIFVPRVDKK